MKVTLANNVATATAANTTVGLAPGKETINTTFNTGAANVGTVSVGLEDGAFKHTVNVAVAAGDSATTVAGKVFAALDADTTVKGHYDVAINGAIVTLTEKVGGVGTATTITVK